MASGADSDQHGGKYRRARRRDHENDHLLQAAPDKKIVVDEVVIEQLRRFTGPDGYNIADLGEIDVRGLDEKVRLFQLIDLAPEILFQPEPITERDRMLVDWICEHIDGAIERDIFSKVP